MKEPKEAEECGQIASRSTVIDQLKMKRAKIARDMTAELKKYDRQIRLAEETDAEAIMRGCYDLLDGIN
jgi:hypothetical protein